MSSRTVTAESYEDAPAFKPGARVRSAKHGRGTVLSVERVRAFGRDWGWCYRISTGGMVQESTLRRSRSR